eukprot:TRINITY_DN8499_c1_g2_i1.p1 TRINITY_DN8499_c1_g2~~TRINITY_DN8499_c1_g2_i1.p1  ORF type:complete len:302 (+),score=67.72 TRINITY_DN8499_c1_g2_i1:109-1014(+)
MDGGRHGHVASARKRGMRRSGMRLLMVPFCAGVLYFVSSPISWTLPGVRSPSVALTALGAKTDSAAEESSAERLARAKKLVQEADAVFFDVDSTVVTTEGIDLLGKCFGVMKEISELTHKAMNGHIQFQDAMAERLELLAEKGMTQETLEDCVKTEGVPVWSPGVQDVIKRFHARDVDVYLVSGGFRNMIRPVAFELHIPQSKVFANTILFDDDGHYVGFDRKAPTSASGGKPAVLKMMQKKAGYKTMIMFGDGATDLDARTKGPAAVFVGYGGVVAREKIKAQADWFIHSFDEILDVLPE